MIVRTVNSAIHDVYNLCFTEQERIDCMFSTLKKTDCDEVMERKHGLDIFLKACNEIIKQICQ